MYKKLFIGVITCLLSTSAIAAAKSAEYNRLSDAIAAAKKIQVAASTKKATLNAEANSLFTQRTACISAPSASGATGPAKVAECDKKFNTSAATAARDAAGAELTKAQSDINALVAQRDALKE